MSEFTSEPERYEAGIIPHDFILVSEEELALRALVEKITTKSEES